MTYGFAVCGLSSLHDLGDFEERSLRLRGVCEGLGGRVRGLYFIGAEHVLHIENMACGLDSLRVQSFQLLNVGKNSAKVLGELLFFFGLQIEPRKFGDPFDIEFHSSLL